MNYTIGTFPIWAVFLIASPIISLIIFFTSNKDEPPVYHRVFGFIGFAISVIFVNSIAEEVIAVLTTFGIIFDLSDSILGLTILAWGNSLGGLCFDNDLFFNNLIYLYLFLNLDLIADISMARHGYTGMSISACFGGPMMSKFLFKSKILI